MSVEMPRPYDNPTPCESEKSYQEGWNDAVAQAQEYVTQQGRRSEQSLDEVMRERDYAQSMADKLAAAIAPEDVLGEHSDGNFPWQNALDWARASATRPSS
jgi:hypothetical protein